MSQRKKLVARIRARPSEMDFDDVCNLLEDFGWQRRRGGKHTAVFSKAGEGHISIPTVKGRKVKRYILDQICTRLELDD